MINMRATTKIALVCALQASSVSAFVGPSPAFRVAKSPVLTSPAAGLKLAPSLAVRPRPNRRTVIKAQAATAAGGPLSVDDKRMFVRWSFVLVSLTR